MSNMSYCRFENTLADLRDCARALDEGEADDGDLDDHERRARDQLVRLCAQIAARHGDEE